MWHNVGLTLLVFVTTLLIVLLLMVCGEWGIRRGAVPHGITHAGAILGARLFCLGFFFFLVVVCFVLFLMVWMDAFLKIICCPPLL